MATEISLAVRTRVIAATPEAFVGTVPPIVQDVTDALAEGADVVAIDLAAAPYIDARGLGLLVKCARACRTHDPRAVIALRGVHRDMATLIALTKIDALFDAIDGMVDDA